MKKILVFCLIGLVMASTAAMAQGKEKAGSRKADASQLVTHPQLAEQLVRALGLMRFLPVAPSAQQMFDILMQNGISPESGWLLDAVVMKPDLARVLIQAMRKEDAVENPNDPQSWINALKELGISLDRLSETIQSVETLPEGMGQDMARQSTDPLVYSVNFAGGNNLQYTLDMDAVIRVFSEMEMILGDFRPISPTPY